MIDKLCSGCGLRKDKSLFYGIKRKSGLCKQCQDDKQRERRILITNYLKSNPCVDCGESHPACLQFDHIDRATKISSVAKMVKNNTPIEKLLAEIAKCAIRCANCHLKRTAIQFNWKYRAR